MSIAQQAKNNSILFLLVSFVLRWGYNATFLFLHVFTPMQSAILHIVFAVISAILGFLAIQLFRKSTPSGSNLGCFFLVLLLLNFLFAIGAMFGGLVHLFSANGGEIETIWLM
jgi:hypothetical protein